MKRILIAAKTCLPISHSASAIDRSGLGFGVDPGGGWDAIDDLPNAPFEGEIEHTVEPAPLDMSSASQASMQQPFGAVLAGVEGSCACQEIDTGLHQLTVRPSIGFTGTAAAAA